MKKLEMAHEYAKIMLDAMVNNKINLKHYNEVAHDSFLLADAMQAEADKRDKAEAEQKRKEMRELLNAENTFIEREGQHFDDVEWQPDWSQAPVKTVAWRKTEHNQCEWLLELQGVLYYNGLAPDFGYTGKWKDSLRKRPENGFKRYYGDGLECAR